MTVKQTVEITNKLGMHARPAMKLFELMQNFDAEVLLRNDEGTEAEANSVIALLMLDSAKGRQIEVEASGPQEVEALAAVIAAEDQKFPEHWGFDVSAIEKALAHNERHETRIRGASTLSQQTAKNLFLWDGRSWLRKGLEAGLTVGIETVWSKKRILTVYLNIAEFGDGIFGVEAAAQRYFHKPASQLTPGEAALLAAVLPNPIRYRADAPSGYVRSRQAWILRQMRQLGGEGFMREHKLY